MSSLSQHERTAARRLRAILWLVLPVLLASAVDLAGEPVVPSAKVIVTLKLKYRGQITGPVLEYDDDQITIEYNQAPMGFVWADLKTPSAYQARKKLLIAERGGKNFLTADDYFGLGMFGLSRDNPMLARQEFDRAIKLDRSFDARAKEAFDEYRERKRRRPQARLPESHDQKARHDRDKLLTDRPGEDHGPLKYEQLPPEVNEKIIEKLRERAREIMAQFEELVMIETPHFIILTDWNESDRKALVKWVERMYEELCDQFDFPPTDNIWLGKCPIYCFRAQSAYVKFARQIDHYEAEHARGYARTATNGYVHIVVYRPGRSVADYDRFATTLVHEGAHAFVHRYHSHGLIGGWISEGLANLIAEKVLNDHCTTGEEAHSVARQYVLQGKSIQDLLAQTGSMPGHDYPVAHSVVEFLIHRDRKAFVQTIIDVKQGQDIEAAIAANYNGMAYSDLEKEWTQYVMRYY